MASSPHTLLDALFLAATAALFLAGGSLILTTPSALLVSKALLLGLPVVATALFFWWCQRTLGPTDESGDSDRVAHR